MLLTCVFGNCHPAALIFGHGLIGFAVGVACTTAGTAMATIAMSSATDRLRMGT